MCCSRHLEKPRTSEVCDCRKCGSFGTNGCFCLILAVSGVMVGGAFTVGVMASETTNQAAAALQQKRRREDAAVRAVTARARAAQVAAQRRREVLARADAEVAEADTGLLVALAGLAVLLRDDAVAAEIANVDVTQVRAAHRRVSEKAVADFVNGLAAGPARRGRRAGPSRTRPGAGPSPTPALDAPEPGRGITAGFSSPVGDDHGA